MSIPSAALDCGEGIITAQSEDTNPRYTYTATTSTSSSGTPWTADYQRLGTATHGSSGGGNSTGCIDSKTLGKQRPLMNQNSFNRLFATSSSSSPLQNTNKDPLATPTATATASTLNVKGSLFTGVGLGMRKPEGDYFDDHFSGSPKRMVERALRNQEEGGVAVT